MTTLTRSYAEVVSHMEQIWRQNAYLAADDEHALLPTVVEANLRRELGEAAAQRYISERTLPLHEVIDNANLIWHHMPNHPEIAGFTRKLEFFDWHIQTHYPEHWDVFSRASGYRSLTDNGQGRFFCTEPPAMTAARRKQMR